MTAGRVQSKCLFCGSEFETWRYLLRQGNGKYCSSKCRNESMKKSREHLLSKAGQRSRRWREKHPNYQPSESAREKHKEWERKRRYDMKELIHNKLGHACSRCGFSDKRALCIDHVNGGGFKELRQMSLIPYLKMVLSDDTGKYQILCHNCNWIKRSENNETRKSNILSQKENKNE